VCFVFKDDAEVFGFPGPVRVDSSAVVGHADLIAGRLGEVKDGGIDA